MFGVLRDREPLPGLEPQPGVAGLGALAERVRATGLPVDLIIEGTPFPLGAAAELTVYRIVQEALTNTIRHAAAGRASVAIGYDAPLVQVRVGRRRDRFPAVGDGPARARNRRDARAGGAARGHPAGRPGARRRLGGLGDPALRPACGAGGVITVLLADDQPLLRRGFRMILEAEDGLTSPGRPATAPRRSSSPVASSPTSC